jgi:putative transcriptional regulator
VDQTSLAPGLLIAMPQLLDPNFQRSVVLLVHHDAEGTFGVVLNRETGITAPSLCATLEIDWRGDQDEGIDWGGPVQPQTGWVLYESATPLDAEIDAEVKNLGEGLCFAGSLEVLRSVAKRPPEHLRLLLGYAGWGPGQLESELAQGAWLLAPLEREVLFEVDLDAMWEYVVRSLGIEPATLAPTHGVH